MASINEKLNYINETKSLIKDKLNDLGSEIDNETTFREYAEKIEDLYDEWPKINDEDTTISLENTKKGKINLQLKGNTNQFTTTGKNKLKTFLPTETTVNDVTITKNQDGTFSLNGTSTAFTRFNITTTTGAMYFTLGELGFNQGDTGKLSGCPQGGDPSMSTSTYRLFMSGGNGASNIYDGGEGATITCNSANMGGRYYLAIDCASGITFNNLTFKPMIEKSSSITEYEPYTGGIASPNPEYPQDIEVVTGENTITISNGDNTESQTFNINLGGLELCKNNDYQDYIYGTFNNWYKKQVINKVILNGTEDWQSASSVVTGSSRFYYDNIDCLNNNIGSAINIHSKNFKAMSWQQIFADDTINKNGIALWASEALTGRIVVRIDNTYANTTNNFKTWLSNNNTKAYFVQTTSTDIPITDTTLITQLNALEQAMSYNNQTNISQENDNLPFILSASALLKNSN